MGEPVTTGKLANGSCKEPGLHRRATAMGAFRHVRFAPIMAIHLAWEVSLNRPLVQVAC